MIRFSDRFNGEYHCTNCGRVTDHPGVMRTLPRRHLRKIIDDAYDTLMDHGVKRVDLNSFILSVDKASLALDGSHIPIVSRKELSEWGYEIVGNTIKRVRRE